MNWKLNCLVVSSWSLVIFFDVRYGCGYVKYWRVLLKKSCYKIQKKGQCCSMTAVILWEFYNQIRVYIIIFSLLFFFLDLCFILDSWCNNFVLHFHLNFILRLNLCKLKLKLQSLQLLPLLLHHLACPWTNPVFSNFNFKNFMINVKFSIKLNWIAKFADNIPILFPLPPRWTPSS